MPSESEKDKIRRVYLIFRVHQDRRILQLNDGSIWDIPGESFPKVAGWHAKQRVEVEWHEGDGETHRLRNLDTDERDGRPQRELKTQ